MFRVENGEVINLAPTLPLSLRLSLSLSLSLPRAFPPPLSLCVCRCLSLSNANKHTGSARTAATHTGGRGVLASALEITLLGCPGPLAFMSTCSMLPWRLW